MTINNDFLLAILSMDAYNQGYSPGVSHGETQIGSATAKPLDAVGVGPELYNEWQDAGFYAVAYDTADGTVISFRGTDDPGSELFSTDFPIIAGSYDEAQLALAVRFYQAVKAANPNDNIILTGHSLGGGLAGYVAGLFNEKAKLFSHIDFTDAALNFATDWNLYGQYTDTDSQAEAYDRYVNDFVATQDNPIPMTGEEFVGIWRALKAHHLDPAHQFDIAQITANHNNSNLISSQYLSGDIAAIVRDAEPQSTAILPSLTGDVSSIVGDIGAHSQSLNTIFKFVQQQLTDPVSGFTTQFSSVLDPVLTSLFDSQLASDLGVPGKNTSGTSYADEKLRDMIAYSALETDSPYGNAGIRAMFNDANQLGTAVTQAGGLQNNPYLTEDIAQTLTDTIVSYAGTLAWNDKNSQDLSGGDASQFNPVNGIVSLNGEQSVLTVDTSALAWNHDDRSGHCDWMRQAA